MLFEAAHKVHFVACVGILIVGKCPTIENLGLTPIRDLVRVIQICGRTISRLDCDRLLPHTLCLNSLGSQASESETLITYHRSYSGQYTEQIRL